jgi:hypothetical protein
MKMGYTMASLEVETLLLIAGLIIGIGIMVASLLISEIPWEVFFLGAAFLPLYRRFVKRYITSLNIMEMDVVSEGRGNDIE